MLYLTLRHRGISLQGRFIIRVLAPPFVILLVLGVAGLLQIDNYVRNEAISGLDRSASSTAAKLEREFAIRQTILKRTGEDLFKIKDDYRRDRQTLETNREQCSNYVKQRRSFVGAPNNVCDPFLPGITSQVATLQFIENSYVAAGKQLVQSEATKIQDRLSAYNLFFPETRVLLVTDNNQQIVSLASSELFTESTESLLPYLKDLDRQPVEGKLLISGDMRLAIFAYPINGGNVLAAYDLTSNSFIRQTWESTPIDRSKALAIMLDTDGNLAYPNASVGESFQTVNNTLRRHQYGQVKLKNIPHVAVGAEAGTSKWLVVVVSPRAVVFGPLHDAQLAAVVIIGLLLVGFLWVGSIFIRRTVGTMMQLVSGALLFAGGKLDYIIRLQKSDREFSQLAETMNIMAWRIADGEKQLDKKNKEFISIATHELRTPLTAILGNLSIVMDDYGDKLHTKVKPLVKQAHAGTLRLRDLVNDMLDMARLDGGRVEFVIQKQDTKKVIKEIMDTLQVTAHAQHIKLKYKHTGVVPVMADLSKLRIVLNNFVSNAIKYNRSGGTVTVSHQHRDGKLVTLVKDTGLGIPKEQQSHIFEKFFRVTDTDRQNVTGTGLGMYITKRYILSMGGQVWFESVHGTGTTFYFSLPVAESKPKSEKLDKIPDAPGSITPVIHTEDIRHDNGPTQ